MKSTGIFAVVTLAGIITGCAQERPAIDRVQANVVPKSFLVGPDLASIEDDPEFYMRGTVVDVGYGAAQDGLFTSTYAQPVSRVKFEITENYLNARLAYERIEGTDGKGKPIDGLRKKTTNDGQIVASYKIVSHFDIKRAYNPTTGEALNIVEENTTDRPWYEREYMRVDWSQNLATDAYDFDTLSMMGIYGGIEYEPLSYTVLDPNDADAPHFDMDAGYFDVTNKAFAKPKLIDLSSLGWGIDTFPACMLPGEFAGGTSPYGNCNPVELTIRQSFRKVVDTDYEPVDFDGIRFQAYGIFNFNYRMGYERNYGMVDDRWFRFAARYNIWERSHYYEDAEAMTGPIACATADTTVGPNGDPTVDPNRDLDGNGTADECEQVTNIIGYGGSQCDAFKQRCTLPYQVRQPVTIPWYINGNTDEDLFEATNWATQEWNLAMQTAIRTSRLVECRRTGGGAGCTSTYPMWSGQQDDYDDAARVARLVEACRRQNGWDSPACNDVADQAAAALASERGNPNDANVAAIASIVKMPPVIVLCHNPVIAGDHPACGPEGLAPRLGDLRYNTVLIIDKPQSPSAWGIMVDADDPVTGEKVAASVNVWSHVTDMAAQQLVDLVRYMNGELRTDEITDGKFVRDWVRASRLSNGGMGPTMPKAEISKRLAAGAHVSPETFGQLVKTELSPELKSVLAAGKRQILDLALDADVPSPSQLEIAARMNGARGTPTEAQLINPAMLQLAGISGNLPVSGVVADLASPLALNNPKVLAQLRQMRENALAKRGACILAEAPEASSLTGIADILKRKFPAVGGESPGQRQDRYERMWRYIRRRYQYAVIAHEMGHSIGLRHNFVSSYGALFFRPQYWQLRTRNGAVTTECTDAVADGSSCVGPRFYDPVTAEEQEQLIWMFMQSSSMDYPGDVSQDMIGLGIWDYAAARFFYGDTVAVYADTAKVSAGSPIGIGITNATDTFGGLSGIKYSVGGIATQGPTDIHYSQLQKEYGVISNCYPVSPQPPPDWNPEVDGGWDPVLDGHVVAIDGQYTKCRQMPVDYAGWTELRQPTAGEIGGGYYRGGPSVQEMPDGTGRLRVPYHFATDHWADLGNVSVFRHDNGADPYEQAMFLITTQENRHIFDNFRRNRSSFSVRAAADRSFSRYNEKLVNIAGGLGMYANIYRNLAVSTGYGYDSLWPFIVDWQVREQMVAATVAFDHLTRQLSRPEDGEHYQAAAALNDRVLHSAKDPDALGTPATSVIIPNGTTGYLRDVGFGGHPIENALSEDHGDFDTEYTMVAGSYYDKIDSIIHMSISEDRFISQSRGDFYDARFRANGMADVFPDGYRRVIANALVGDRSILAPHLAADSSGRPLLDSAADPNRDPLGPMYPARPVGWTSWWPTAGPEVCFPSNGRNVCAAYDGSTLDFDPELPANIIPVDPEVGWEVQKFVIAWALAYVTANQNSNWVDMMRIYRLGANTTPEFQNRIEWQDPTSGQIYYARTYGKECFFGTGPTCQNGELVQKGIAARVLEYADELTAKGYKLDTSTYATGYNEFGRPMVAHHPSGAPIVLSDPAIKVITSDGYVGSPKPDCDQNIDSSCTPLVTSDNRWAHELEGYKSVPDYLWEVAWRYQLSDPGELGLYP